MYKVLKVCLCPSQDAIYFRPGIVITYFMPCGSHLFLELFAYAKQANTHINIHHDLKDVKLWQIHTLLKGLEKIAVSADIPMLVCGDFNSIPGRFVRY